MSALLLNGKWQLNEYRWVSSLTVVSGLHHGAIVKKKKETNRVSMSCGVFKDHGDKP